MTSLLIKDWGTVFQNADETDLPPGAMVVCRNMRPVNGWLVKTHGVGVKLDATLDGIRNLVTYIESNLSGGGYKYIAVLVNESTKLATWYAWNGTAWELIENTFPNFTGNGTDWYAKAARNPIVQNGNILRFLPGATGKPNGSGEAKGVWLGRIDRLFFDSLYDKSGAQAGYYNYACSIEAPEIPFEVVQQPGDGAFSVSESGIQINNLSEGNDTVTIAGVYVNVFRGGSFFEIEGNTTNYGKYKVDRSSIDNGQTVIGIDTGYRDWSGSEVAGTVRAVTVRDTRYYKFSYVYDGVQESLLSGAVKVEFEPERFLQLGFDIVKASHNKRITALNIYRSSSGTKGTFRLVHVIDFLRKQTDVTTGANGFYSGERTIYLPDMDGVSSSGGSARIKLWNPHHSGWDTFNVASMGASTTRVLFTMTADVHTNGYSDYWDCPWQYLNDGVTVTAEGSNNAFGGRRTGIVGSDMGNDPLAGSVIIAGYTAATKGSGYHRMIDANKLRALHFTADIEAGASAPSDANWRLLRIEKGLYFAAEYGDSSHADYMFFDTGLSEGRAHPLEGETSVRVNGDHAILISNRLWQGNPVLDPGDKEEDHEGKASYSELLQPDVNPVSNLLPLPDREGGRVTGIVDMMGNPLYLKPNGMFMISVANSPASPANWAVTHSPHNIGNVAEAGYIEVLGSAYITYWDGFYRVSASNLSGADRTPTEKLKISDPIDNIFKAMTEAQKQAVVATYDWRESEVVFAFAYTIDGTTYNVAWAYNIWNGNWREIKTDKYFDLVALDENRDVMVYDDTIDKVCGLAEVDDNTRATVRLPFSRLSMKRKTPLRYIYVTYVSASALLLKIYSDYDAAPVRTVTLEATSKAITKKIRPQIRGRVAAVEITEDHPDYLVTEATPVTAGYLVAALSGGTSPNTKIGDLEMVFD